MLVERGDQLVLMSTVKNRGAKLSNAGFSILVQRTEGDEELAVRIAERTEIPPHLFRQLLARASLSVREKLKAAHPEHSQEIDEVVEEVSSRIESDALTPLGRLSRARRNPRIRHRAQISSTMTI